LKESQDPKLLQQPIRAGNRCKHDNKAFMKNVTKCNYGEGKIRTHLFVNFFSSFFNIGLRNELLIDEIANFW
jgi:hypothetical protein